MRLSAFPIPVVALACAVLLPTQGLAQTAPDGAGGEAVYRTVCRLCHETRIGPALLGRQLPPVLIRQIVRHGRNGMPAFRPSEISDETLAGLARFIERSAAPEAVQ